jgi:pimeloyl-ACP methyl ester carboxylesterase
MPAPRDRTPVLLLHGFWHGSWCWTEVLAGLTGAGVRALAVDMAGHGLRARRPVALTRRPFDAGALAAEVSPVAGVDLDQAGDLLVTQVKQLGAGAPVTVVAHSMGGAVLTRAGQLAPDAPVGISAGVTALTADGWGSISRTYVVCTGDATIPPALQRKFIADADAAFPDNPTAVRELEAAHSPFLSMPDQVAGIVLDVLS